MYQIACQLGLLPRPHLGSLQPSPDPRSWFNRLLLKEEKRRGEEFGFCPTKKKEKSAPIVETSCDGAFDVTESANLEIGDCVCQVVGGKREER